MCMKKRIGLNIFWCEPERKASVAQVVRGYSYPRYPVAVHPAKKRFGRSSSSHSRHLEASGSRRPGRRPPPPSDWLCAACDVSLGCSDVLGGFSHDFGPSHILCFGAGVFVLPFPTPGRDQRRYVKESGDRLPRRFEWTDRFGGIGHVDPEAEDGSSDGEGERI